jgi:predicted nuclease with TOPRIM domain
LRDLNSSNGSFINDKKLKEGKVIKLNNLDKLKFGKDPTQYIFETNKMLQNSEDNLTEVDNTLVFQSMIKDDKISLVNEEFYTKATRNHLENKNVIKKENDSNNIKARNSNSLKLPNLHNMTNASLKFVNNKFPHTDSPEFLHDSLEVNKKKSNYDLDVTFKQSQQSQDEFNRLKHFDSNMNSMFEKMKNENENLIKKNLELEEKLLEKSNEIKRISNDLDQLNEEYGKLNAKHNALMIYASEIQKKLDLLEMEITDKRVELNRIKNFSDWGKVLSEKENFIKILQNELKFYKEEFDSKIKNVSSQSDIKNHEYNNYTNIKSTITRLENLIDSYIQENKKYKRILEEHKSRENDCNKKWNELLKENKTNIEQINLLKLQFDKQFGELNNVIADYDMRVVDTMNKIPKVCFKIYSYKFINFSFYKNSMWRNQKPLNI